MRVLPSAALALSLAAALGFAACSSGNDGNSAGDHFKQGADQMAQGAKQAASDVGQVASDSAITTKVKANLAANQGLSSFSIHVETTKGVVTLTGTVDSEAARQLAGSVAAKTGGVRVVVNKLEVKGG